MHSEGVTVCAMAHVEDMGRAVRIYGSMSFQRCPRFARPFNGITQHYRLPPQGVAQHVLGEFAATAKPRQGMLGRQSSAHRAWAC